MYRIVLHVCVYVINNNNSICTKYGQTLEMQEIRILKRRHRVSITATGYLAKVGPF
jgi:hypothetical protein